MQIIQKIPVFSGLTVDEAERLIAICTFRRYKQDTVIYEARKPSDEMLVLLSGRLGVISPEGEALGEVSPGQSTG